MEFTAITMFPVSAVCLDEPSDCTIVTGVVIVELLPGHSFSPLGDTTLPKPGVGDVISDESVVIGAKSIAR